ncbi:MAG TPA: ABC transporter substrate-binding protein [Verrucomicrobiae bacterium]|jgi:ABC-type nitrate/sulfonate/bicarbonate transport system substrate-binding protein|nr:ABC transporter substrate-binding protein [Verrucomicrobiae bacterium]
MNFKFKIQNSKFKICALVLLLAAQAVETYAQEKKTVRLVTVSFSWNSALPGAVALRKGYYKEQGLALESIFIRGGPAAIAALVSGDADFGSIGGAQAIMRSRARGLDVVIIGSISNAVNYVVIGAKGVKSLADLKGKIVGVTGAGAFSEFAMQSYLKRNNLEPGKDVTLRAVGNTTMRAVALESGLIAAAPFSPEDAVRLVSKGYPMIVNLGEALPIPETIIVARTEFLAKYPETAKRFLKGLVQGIHFVKTNKAEAIKMGYEAGLKGEPDIVNKAYDLFAPALTPDLSVGIEGLQQILDEDIRNGFVDKQMTVDKAVDTRILKLTQQELRREGRLP